MIAEPNSSSPTITMPPPSIHPINTILKQPITEPPPTTHIGNLGSPLGGKRSAESFGHEHSDHQHSTKASMSHSPSSHYEACLSSFVIKTPRTWKILVDPTLESSTLLGKSASDSSPEHHSNLEKEPAGYCSKTQTGRMHLLTNAAMVGDEEETEVGTGKVSKKPIGRKRLRRQSYPTVPKTRLAPAPAPIAEITTFTNPANTNSPNSSPKPITNHNHNSAAWLWAEGTRELMDPDCPKNHSVTRPHQNLRQYPHTIDQADPSHHVIFSSSPPSAAPSLLVPSSFLSKQHQQPDQREYTFVPDRRSFNQQRRSQSLSIPMPSSQFQLPTPPPSSSDNYSHHLCLAQEMPSSSGLSPLTTTFKTGDPSRHECLSSRGELLKKHSKLTQGINHDPSSISNYHFPLLRPGSAALTPTSSPPPPPHAPIPTPSRTLTFHQTEFDSKTLRPIDRPLEEDSDSIGPHLFPQRSCRTTDGFQQRQQRSFSEGAFIHQQQNRHSNAGTTMLPQHIEEAAQILLGLKSIRNN